QAPDATARRQCVGTARRTLTAARGRLRPACAGHAGGAGLIAASAWRIRAGWTGFPACRRARGIVRSRAPATRGGGARERATTARAAGLERRQGRGLDPARA